MAGSAVQVQQTEGQKQTLYARRNVLNASDIIEHFKANGFDKMVPPEEMHVTVAHSSEPLDWTAPGDSFDALIAHGGTRSVEPLGDKGAVVLKFNNGELQDRFDEFIDAGASWDFPSYQPHVTLTYNGADLNLSGMPIYDGPILLGPEIFEEMTEGWSDKLVEKRARIFKAQTAPALGLVFGWLITCTVDGEDYYDLNIDVDEATGEIERVPEHITVAAMLKGALLFGLGDRPGNVMHEGPDLGCFPFLMPITNDLCAASGMTSKIEGLLGGFYPPPEIMQKYIDKTFTGFSMEGGRVKFEEHDDAAAA